MKLKYLFFILSFTISTLSVAQSTQRVYLSGKDAARTVEWDFYVTDGIKSGEWSKIQVPSNWELQGFGNYNYGHDWKDTSKKLGKEHGLYKTTFHAKSEWNGQSVSIIFEGAMTDTRVKINGKSVGVMHQGGFNPFRYEIGHLLKYGQENLLEVDVAKHSANESVNKAERQADFWIFGGIYRPVYLEIAPETHISRAAIDAKSGGEFRALLEINDKLSKAEVRCEIFDAASQEVGEAITASIPRNATQLWLNGTFTDIKSWNPESPQLYTAQFTLLQNDKVIHQRKEKFGFRTVELRKKDGFYVNGQKVIFKGVNRHSFWPETGRALSEENHLQDIQLMKEMNMNAVRMSHYQPDQRFLQLCDSLGLFVLDELTGWQDGYDTVVGPKLIKELVLQDENHPSVIVWNHGNEGGWDFANEKYFHQFDIQKRPIIYPWLLRNWVDTKHYISYDFAINRFTNGTDVFMPTEFLHGMYDGGLGAGLADYWRKYRQSPRFAGGFLWVFADEAVLRTDKSGKVYDSDGNHAPDGIVGPHREKEGSFYTIKKIWSPVKIEPVVIHEKWDGKLLIKNEYLFSNLNRCNFQWQAVKVDALEHEEEVLIKGNFKAPDVLPGEMRQIQLDLNEQFQLADYLRMQVLDQQEKVINSWSWPIQLPAQFTTNFLQETEGDFPESLKVQKEGNKLKAEAANLMVAFDLNTGTIDQVSSNGETISISGGPVPVGVNSVVKEVAYQVNEGKRVVITSHYDNYPHKIVIEFFSNGLLKIIADPIQTNLKNIEYLGIGFKYPADKSESINWLGDGPYRVWKNRLQGPDFGLYHKDYNNTITGESFNNLVYPEFKGYFANLYAAQLQTSEGPLAVFTETPNLYLHLFTPPNPQHVKGGSMAAFPSTDISFLYEIPAIGTKFKSSEELGPSGQKGVYQYKPGQLSDPIVLWFDFRGR